MRKKIKNVARDRALFKRTAQRTKAINVPTAVPRGGIRL